MPLTTKFNSYRVFAADGESAWLWIPVTRGIVFAVEEGVSQKVLVGYVPGREQPSLLYLTADYIFLLNRGICVRGDLVLGYVGLSLLGRVVSATWVYHRGLCYVPAIPTAAAEQNHRLHCSGRDTRERDEH